MINFFKIYVLPTILLLILVSPGLVLGQTGSAPGGNADLPTGSAPGGQNNSSITTSFSVTSPLTVKTLEEFITLIISAIVQVGAIVLTFAIIYTGFLFVKARGNEGELTKAKEAFMGAVVGGLIILGAFVILQIIQGTVDQIL